VLLLAGCALLPRDWNVPSELKSSWAEQWNQRLSDHLELWDHPCGDPEFTPWAEAFLDTCIAERMQVRRPLCGHRWAWVRARADQCQRWKAWLGRNFNQQQRSDAPEPSMRIP
jgi:hypothetical protein